jgi:hypothetical protein
VAYRAAKLQLVYHRTPQFLINLPARCSTSNRILNSRMPLVSRCEQACDQLACDQSHSSRVSLPLTGCVRVFYDVTTPKAYTAWMTAFGPHVRHV